MVEINVYKVIIRKDVQNKTLFGYTYEKKIPKSMHVGLFMTSPGIKKLCRSKLCTAKLDLRILDVLYRTAELGPTGTSF